MIPWREQKTGAEAYWDAIRAALPPLKFPRPAPTVTLEVTDNEDKDVKAFRQRRQRVLASMSKP